jgi:hypothetical protein
VSKAALVRRFVRERLHPLPPLSADPLSRLSGSASFTPQPVDDVMAAEGRLRHAARAHPAGPLGADQAVTHDRPQPVPA